MPRTTRRPRTPITEPPDRDKGRAGMCVLLWLMFSLPGIAVFFKPDSSYYQDPQILVSSLVVSVICLVYYFSDSP